jgi:hypothetical protein
MSLMSDEQIDSALSEVSPASSAPQQLPKPVILQPSSKISSAKRPRQDSLPPPPPPPPVPQQPAVAPPPEMLAAASSHDNRGQAL